VTPEPSAPATGQDQLPWETGQGVAPSVVGTDPAALEGIAPAPVARPRPPRRPAAPDDWKKGISVFGGG
jgi:hypothetical protein